jgi:hypothetical protein
VLYPAVPLDDDRKWCRATFRIFSEALTSGEITVRLGVSPTGAYEAGDPVSSRSPDHIRREAGWFLESGIDDTEPMHRHLAALLTRLEPAIDRLRELAPECRLMDFFCGFSSSTGQGGFELEPELLERLTRIPGQGLKLDLYSPGRPEPEIE